MREHEWRWKEWEWKHSKSQVMFSLTHCSLGSDSDQDSILLLDQYPDALAHIHSNTHLYWVRRVEERIRRKRDRECIPVLSMFHVMQLHQRTRKVWVCPDASKRKACCRWKNMDSQFLQQIYRLEMISNHQVMHLVSGSDAANQSGPSYQMISIKFRCLFVLASIRVRSFTVPLGELNRWITGTKSNSQCIWSARIGKIRSFSKSESAGASEMVRVHRERGSGRKFESFHSSTPSHLPTHHLRQYMQS